MTSKSTTESYQQSGKQQTQQLSILKNSNELSQQSNKHQSQIQMSCKSVTDMIQQSSSSFTDKSKVKNVTKAPSDCLQQKDNRQHQLQYPPPKNVTNSQDDPCPLVPPPRSPGGTPPKVIKRKAPPPTNKADEESVSQVEQKNFPVIPRPAQQQLKPKEIPKQPQQQLQQPSQGNTHHQLKQQQMISPKSQLTDAIPKFEVTLANSENSTNETSRMSAGYSTEQLLSSSGTSPEPLRPVNRIEDVNTIKRQPKDGWI